MRDAFARWLRWVVIQRCRLDLWRFNVTPDRDQPRRFRNFLERGHGERDPPYGREDVSAFLEGEPRSRSVGESFP